MLIVDAKATVAQGSARRRATIVVDRARRVYQVLINIYTLCRAVQCSAVRRLLMLAFFVGTHALVKFCSLYQQKLRFTRV